MKMIKMHITLSWIILDLANFSRLNILFFLVFVDY